MITILTQIQWLFIMAMPIACIARMLLMKRKLQNQEHIVMCAAAWIQLCCKESLFTYSSANIALAIM